MVDDGTPANTVMAAVRRTDGYLWVAHLRFAWRDIDAAVAAVPEIRFDARHR